MGGRIMNERIARTAELLLGATRITLGMKCSEWCAELVSAVLTENGLEIYTDTSCNAMFNKMKSSSYWCLPDNNPARGDIIFFDWDGALDAECKTRPLDHVGIVTACDGKTLTYIDGNSDTSGIVKKHTIILDWCKFNGTYPWYYMRYTTPTPKTKNITDRTYEELMTALETIEKNIKIIRDTIDKV